jgi:hypothetical protein
MDENQPDYRPEEATAAAINIGQVIQGSMVILLGDMAAMDAAIKFRKLTTDDFQDFYQKFCHIFLMARRYLDPGNVAAIQIYLEAPIPLEKTQESADRALVLALAMKEDLEDKGLWSVFGPAGEPPFMMDVIA